MWSHGTSWEHIALLRERQYLGVAAGGKQHCK